MFLSVIIKNLNWEILTRIQLLLNNGVRLKMENFNIMQVHQKGGHKKKQYIRRNCLKKGAWTVCRFVFPFFQTRAIQTSSYLLQLIIMHITHWFELLYKIPLILYHEHLQDFTKEMSSSYFMSLQAIPKSRPRLIKK